MKKPDFSMSASDASLTSLRRRPTADTQSIRSSVSTAGGSEFTHSSEDTVVASSAMPGAWRAKFHGNVPGSQAEPLPSVPHARLEKMESYVEAAREYLAPTRLPPFALVSKNWPLGSVTTSQMDAVTSVYARDYIVASRPERNAALMKRLANVGVLDLSFQPDGASAPFPSDLTTQKKRPLWQRLAQTPGASMAGRLQLVLQAASRVEELNLENSLFGKDELTHVAKTISERPYLRRLKLNAHAIDESVLKVFSEAHEKTTKDRGAESTLGYLSIPASYRQQGREAEVFWLSEWLSHVPSLQEFNLPLHSFLSPARASLLASIGRLHHLKTVDLRALSGWVQNTDFAIPSAFGGFRHTETLTVGGGYMTASAQLPRLLAATASMPKLRSLRIEECSMGDWQLQALANSLSRAPHIKELHLMQMEVEPDAFRKFLFRDATLEGLETFLCEGRMATRATSVPWFRLVAALPQVKSLTLKHVFVEWSEHSSSALSSRFSPTLQHLTLADCKIGKTEAPKLEETLAECTQLKTLDLSDNFLGCRPDPRTWFLLAYPGASLPDEKIDVDTDFIAARALASIVARAPTLQLLNLSGNRLNDGGFQVFAPSLRNSTELESLDVSTTDLTTIGLQALADGLSSATSLRTLNLARSEIKAGEFDALGHLLAQLPRVQRLDLSHACPPIGFLLHKELDMALEQARSLRVVRMEGVDLGLEGVRSFERLAAALPGLRRFELGRFSRDERERHQSLQRIVETALTKVKFVGEVYGTIDLVVEDL